MRGKYISLWVFIGFVLGSLSLSRGGDCGGSGGCLGFGRGQYLMSLEGRVLIRSVWGDSCEIGRWWGIHGRVRVHLDSLPRGNLCWRTTGPRSSKQNLGNCSGETRRWASGIKIGGLRHFLSVASVVGGYGGLGREM